MSYEALVRNSAWGMLLACALAAMVALFGAQPAYADIQPATSNSLTTAANALQDEAVMYRLYNPNTGEHFYTSSQSELVNLSKAGWNYEGTSWYSTSKELGKPVYRLYNDNAGDHHYTMNSTERTNLKNAGWNDEGVAFYALSVKIDGAEPVYREYNPNATSGSHNYTMSETEHKDLIAKGWKDEGISWYAAPFTSTDDDIIKAGGPLFRAYNKTTGEHYYSPLIDDMAELAKKGWTFEGTAWTNPPSSDANTHPVYLVQNPTNGDHHYTMSTTERDGLVAAGWKSLGIIFYSGDTSMAGQPYDSEKTVYMPVFRLYNPNATSAGAHHFTMNEDEVKKLVKAGWKAEGVQWCSIVNTA